MVHKGVQIPNKSRLGHTNTHSSGGAILAKDFQKHNSWHVYNKGLTLKYSLSTTGKAEYMRPSFPVEQGINSHFLAQHKSEMKLQYYVLVKDWPEFLAFPGQVDDSSLQR